MKLVKKALLTSLIFLLLASFQAQSQKLKTPEPAPDTSMKGMKMDEEAIDIDTSSMMSSSFSRTLPMSRDGSGTSWLPDAAPLHALMFSAGKWQFMAHYNLFLRYNSQDIFKAGSRGAAKFDAPNMEMLMGQRRVGARGLFHFGIMTSLDPLTEGGYGYPLLYQTGESWKGKALIDRQHPHDLFSEVSASYSYAFSKRADAFLYVGYPGEPALGPVTFMHRPSGMDGPDAPIGHHWQDATHITFGVATLGFRYETLKIEGSSFTGREPNENRYNFDKPRFDSWSGRLSFNPSKNWALQVSRGFIKSPEMLRPEENVTRTTASANYASEFSPGKFFTSNLVWGYNQTPGQPGAHSAGLEGALDLNTFSIYSRYEWVQKSIEELLLDPLIYGRKNFSLNVISVGFNQKIFGLGSTNVSLGAQASTNFSPQALSGLYGRSPIGAEVFLRVFPSLMNMHSSKKMGHMDMR